MYEKTEEAKLQQLLQTYGEIESIQDYQESSTDSQLNSIFLIIEELIQNNIEGTVLDIGCGKGILLSKLSQGQAFIKQVGWMYVGADYNNLDDILQLAMKLKLHRRCDVIKLDILYDSWISSVRVPEPTIIFIRNVFHELDIHSTARLLHLLVQNMHSEDTLLIQDLLVFPQAERGNVCWDTECLESALCRLDFNPIPAKAKSNSGAQWISMKIKKKESAQSFTLDEVINIVAEERANQLEKWRKIQKFPSDIRLEKIARLDFDLQLAALYNQLNDVGRLTQQQKKEITRPNPQQAFQLSLREYDSSILSRDKFKLPFINNFRDRANSQDSFEHFLTSEDIIVIIKGGAFCGKTALVSFVLSRRAHGRSIIPIDCAASNDIWPILEQYLLAIGCQSSLGILKHEKDLKFSDLKMPLSQLINIISKKTIVVFDHFENILDPNGQIMNSEISDFLYLISVVKNAKIVITTRREPMLSFLPESVGIDNDQPLVGRFPEGPYVKNILDDYVDRVAIELEEYPEELLNAIDRYPYLATLAGKLISEVGISVTQDPLILDIIKSYLYDELAKKIISPGAKPALKLASILRIPTPRCLLEDIVGEESINAALETGLLFKIPDRYRNDLLTCAAALREEEISVDSGEMNIDEETVQKSHLKIAKCYENIAYGSNDPRWIREAHYHYLLSGGYESFNKVGSLYKDELFWAGKVLFRKFHDYKGALDALRASEAMGFITYESRMLIAACLIRTGSKSEGEIYYKKLISEFPNRMGIKTSYVDSLLSIKAYNDALLQLEEFGFSETDSTAWIMGQFGRAYMGLHDYLKAIESFEMQLQKGDKAEVIVFVRLAQVYFRYGDRDKAQESIIKGLKVYKDDPVLNSLYYANLIKDNTEISLLKAKERLNDLLVMYPRNGYILQKLVIVSSALGDMKEILKQLDKIHYQVVPAYLEIPTRIAVLLAQNNFAKALELADALPKSEEYVHAIIYKIFHTWATSEQRDERKQRIAKMGMQRELPRDYYRNVPMLAMYVQLAHMAGCEEKIEDIMNFVSSDNQQMVRQLIGEDDSVDNRNFEPEWIL